MKISVETVFQQWLPKTLNSLLVRIRIRTLTFMAMISSFTIGMRWTLNERC
jgi:hypothetical protein